MMAVLFVLLAAFFAITGLVAVMHLIFAWVDENQPHNAVLTGYLVAATAFVTVLVATMIQRGGS